MVIPLATTIWLSTIVSRFVLAFLTSIPKQFNPFITRADAAQVTSLGEQLAQAGQLAADVTEDDKLRAAQKMVDDQIVQMEAQLKTVEAGQARESQQRFIGGTITAVVLAIAFVLLAFTAVL